MVVFVCKAKKSKKKNEKKCKKKLKKVLTKLFEDGIVILVLKERATKRK